MKRILVLLLAVILVISCTACGGKKESKQEPEKQTVTEAPKPVTAVEDTDAMNLHFTAPEGYDTVERYIGITSAGKVTEKSFNYSFADNSSVMIGYTVGKELTDSVPQSKLDKATAATYAGKAFQVVEEGKNFVALCQEDDVIYGIGYAFGDKADKAKFESLMAGISFTDATTTAENDDDMFGIEYDAKGAGNICSTTSSVTQKADGTVVEKMVGWHYGADEKNLDYRFLIRVYKDTTVEEKLNKYAEYEEKEVGGIKYTVKKADDNQKPYEYYTQHGSDVYKIYNNGVSENGSIKRSEQCQSAFENFVNSIHF
ncbi:MAG: hypothetical protein IJI67_08125 [Clostridia bacterium]|nr:hypothetical protein [Clostridia bacterium]